MQREGKNDHCANHFVFVFADTNKLLDLRMFMKQYQACLEVKVS